MHVNQYWRTQMTDFLVLLAVAMLVVLALLFSVE